ncbi:zf-HC2 domain-containing protein [Alcanivorax sp.]|jgi:anti-sigma factor ChrR (cupin superfamily)|uniref:anti-sigma factor family protein n=1 Tax=Alcanivorax sp. TaxID=1872427 RepID=UPI002B266AF4|nr:zf-HC2 domain-containing protein [Alcanivorax sp.]
MLKCKDVVEKADALVDGSPLTWRERLAMRLHLLICHHCRRYVRQLRALLHHLPRNPDSLEDVRTQEILERLDTPQDH